MIGRLVTLARRLLGLGLIAAVTWWFLEELIGRLGEPGVQVAVDAETGERYGFQVSPLTPSQRQAALERDAALAAELLG